MRRIAISLTKKEWDKIKKGNVTLLLQHKKPQDQEEWTVLVCIDKLVVGEFKSTEAGILEKIGSDKVGGFRILNISLDEMYDGTGKTKKEVFELMRGKDLHVWDIWEPIEYQEKLEIIKYGIHKKSIQWQYVKE